MTCLQQDTTLSARLTQLQSFGITILDTVAAMWWNTGKAMEKKPIYWYQNKWNKNRLNKLKDKNGIWKKVFVEEADGCIKPLFTDMVSTNDSAAKEIIENSTIESEGKVLIYRLKPVKTTPLLDCVRKCEMSK